MYNKVLQFGTGIGGLTQILSSLDNVTSTLKQVATDLAAMDDVYSDVIKTTGMTREQVEELNESFKNLDTRTSREQLNNLAYIAGKLGISSKELVQQFVEAADIINVSMGDVLGDDATLAIGKMVDIYKNTPKIRPTCSMNLTFFLFSAANTKKSVCLNTVSVLTQKSANYVCNLLIFIVL